VIYNHDALREALEWLDACFGRRGAGGVDSRGKWLALLFVGLIALARPAARLLPQIAPVPSGPDCTGAAFGRFASGRRH